MRIVKKLQAAFLLVASEVPEKCLRSEVQGMTSRNFKRKKLYQDLTGNYIKVVVSEVANNIVYSYGIWCQYEVQYQVLI
jgi:hypothetical protein